MKIVVSGYYGFKNSGDEAILEAIISGFKQQKLEAEIVVLSASPRQTAETYGITSTHRFDISTIQNCDVFVSGGGGLLQDATSNRSFLYYLGLIWIAKALGKKTVIFTQGIGPIKNSFNRLLLRFVLNKADLITVRDENSLLLLRKWGITNPNIFVTADPTFILSPEGGEKFLELEGIKKGLKPLIGISIRDFDLDRFLIARIFDEIVKRFNAQIIFIPFQYPEDIEASRKVMDEMSQSSTLIFRQCSPREILGIIREMDLFIGMRLHSLIFAIMNKVPCLGISYDPKVESFMGEVEMPCLKTNEIKVETLIKILEDLINNQTEIKSRLETQRQKLYDRAWLNFKIFQDKIGG